MDMTCGCMSPSRKLNAGNSVIAFGTARDTRHHHQNSSGRHEADA